MFQLFVIFVFLHVWGVIFDHVDNISDLEFIMDSRMVFANHVDIVVGKAWAMLGFVKRISNEFRVSYTFKTVYVSMMHPNLDNVCMCVCGGL
jgi:hypothetical protein